MSLEAGRELVTHTERQGIDTKEVTWNSERVTCCFRVRAGQNPQELPDSTLPPQSPSPLEASTHFAHISLQKENHCGNLPSRTILVIPSNESEHLYLPPLLLGQGLTKNSKMMLESGQQYSKLTVPDCFRLTAYISVAVHSSVLEEMQSPRGTHLDL